MDVVHKEPYLFVKFLLNGFGKLFVILLECPGAEDFHFLRSAIKSSTVSKDFVFPAAISLSASASAFVQSKSLKYGGMVRAYLINSATASSVLFFWADFLYFSTSLKISSDRVIVNSLVPIYFLLFRENTIPLNYKSIFRDYLSLLPLIHPHPWYLLKVFVEGEDGKVVFDGKGSDRNIS